MADNRIGLNLVTLKGGREAERLLENLDRVQAAGFGGVGIWVETLEGWDAMGGSMAELAREANERGLHVDEVCFVGVPTSDSDLHEQVRAFEWARELDAGCVIAIYGGSNNPLERARADWVRFMDAVASCGVPAAFEFIGAWRQYNSPLKALSVVEAADLGRIVFDTFHFWRGGGDLDEIPQIPPERVALVHLNDVSDVPRERAADSDRTYPGEGIMPLAEICGGLIANGYTGPFNVEIFGEVQEQDPDEVCRRAFSTASELIARL